MPTDPSGPPANPFPKPPLVPATPKPAPKLADDLPEIPDAKVLEYQKRGGHL